MKQNDLSKLFHWLTDLDANIGDLDAQTKVMIVGKNDGSKEARNYFNKTSFFRGHTKRKYGSSRISR